MSSSAILHPRYARDALDDRAPAKERWLGVEGHPSTLNGKPIRVTAAKSVREGITYAGYSPKSGPGDFLPGFTRLLERGRTRGVGDVSVTLADGKAYTAPVVIAATGLRGKSLGVPGEDRFEGRGMIHCAFCDAGFYTGKHVAVVGGGDAGVIEALYLAKFADKVHLVELAPTSCTRRSCESWTPWDWR